MKHKFSTIEEAYQFTDTETCPYLDRESGRIFYDSHFDDSFPPDMRLPDDFEDNPKYIAIPEKNDLDLGTRLVFRFVQKCAPELYDDVSEIFSSRGAYRRFKDFLQRKDQLDAWHTFEEEQTSEALRQWCRLNGIELAAEE